MKKSGLLLTVVLMCVSPAIAQDDYRKLEFFGGYSVMNFDNAAGNTNNAAVNDVLGEKETLRGFNLAVNYNFHKYVGVKFDYSLHLREDNFSRPLGSGTIDTTVQNFLFGAQFKNNKEDDPIFKPFGHVLAGVAVQKIDIDSPQLPAVFGVNDFSVNETSLAFALGGGLDIKISRRIDARVGQVDWNIIRRGDQNIPGLTPGTSIIFPNTRQDNLRLSFGIVIH
jgi:opacity protein-like surface antigen